MNRATRALLIAWVVTALVAFVIELGPGIIKYAQEKPPEAVVLILAGILLGLGMGGKR